MAKYAIKGYEVDAMDFVLKPVSYFAFSVKLGKALGVLSSRVQHSLIVPSEGGIRKVPAEDVYLSGGRPRTPYPRQGRRFTPCWARSREM